MYRYISEFKYKTSNLDRELHRTIYYRYKLIKSQRGDTNLFRKVFTYKLTSCPDFTVLRSVKSFKHKMTSKQGFLKERAMLFSINKMTPKYIVL